jgi:hypothetical protein
VMCFALAAFFSTRIELMLAVLFLSKRLMNRPSAGE